MSVRPIPSDVVNGFDLMEDLPSVFNDPISSERMRRAVIDPCGHTFDATSIQFHMVCPYTGKPLTHSCLIPNRVVQNALDVLDRSDRQVTPPAAATPLPERIILDLTPEEQDSIRDAAATLRENNLPHPKIDLPPEELSRIKKAMQAVEAATKTYYRRCKS